jgi:protein arginine kinase activator
MKCQHCAERATVHLTDIVKGHKKETHLCQACAEKQKLVQQQELILPAIVQALLGKEIGPVNDELSRLTCPSCGIKYMEFRAAGRLGCPRDYEVFRTGLEPLLQRIHRSGRHVGKVPRQRQRSPAAEAELLALRKSLREAVDAEQYEEAARFRDLIRQKESAEC